MLHPNITACLQKSTAPEVPQELNLQIRRYRKFKSEINPSEPSGIQVPLSLTLRRRVIYVCRNNEACSYNHCCSGKSISITYCECVFVASVNQYSMRMRHIVICGLPGSTICFHIIL